MSLSAADRPIEGILWMFVTGLCFVAVTGSVRYLGTDLPAAEAAFLRFVFGTILLAPALAQLVRRGLPAGSFKLFAARGALHSIATLLWFYAMARLPVAEVTAIGYLNPIVVTLGAAIFFGERLAFRRLAAVGVALIGAIVILRPGLREVTPGHFAQLSAAVFFGMSYLIVKHLSGLVSATAVVAMMSVTVTIGLMPFAVLVWIPPNAAQLAILAFVAMFATAGHYCMTRAFAAAPLTVTQPVIFLQLVWAAILGRLAFGEQVDPFVLLGGSLIITAILYITWREARIKKAGLTPLPEAEKI